MNINKQLVIPMSGVGRRFVDAGFKLPKPLIEVMGKPIIQHVLDMYPGWSEILFIVNSDHFEDPDLQLEKILMNMAPTAKIKVIAPHKKGPSHAVYQSEKLLINDGPIVINYCDFAGNFDLQEFEKKIFEYDSVLLTYTGFHPHMLRSSNFAYIKEINGKIVGIKEKESYTNSPMTEQASAGTYSFRNKSVLIKSIEDQIMNNYTLNNELYSSLTVKSLIENGGNVASVLMTKFFQWGTPEDLSDFNYWMGAIDAINLENSDVGSVENHIVLLAGGKGTRTVPFTSQAKPLISVAGSYLWQHAFKARNKSSQTHLLVREELLKFFNQDLFQSIFMLKQDSRGQADSALIGMQGIKDDLPVTILSSDCILPSSFTTKVLKTFEKENLDIAVWTNSKYPAALIEPNSFSWIISDQDNTEVYVKTFPLIGSEKCHLITGNFTFRSASLARELIGSLIADTDKQVKAEFFLDSVLQIAIEKGLKVGKIEVPNFLSLGTVAELETFRYWSEYKSGKTYL